MSKDLKKIFIRFLQVIIVLSPIALFFYLLNIFIVPGGVFTTERVVNERSPYIDAVLPDARVEAPYQNDQGEWEQKIIGDPAFFFVHPQRSFQSVEAEISFKNSTVPIVEFGVLADATTNAYTLESLQNLIIDNSPWSRIEKDGTILLQRENKFSSLNEFLSALPARQEIATYHYGLVEPYRLKDYKPSTVEQAINISLRGTHEFYTYIKSEQLNFVFSYMDMNRQVGADAVDLLVINEGGQPVAEVRDQDDGDTTNEGNPSSLKELTLSADNLPEGIYKIQMKVNEDIFFRSIKTIQQKVTFLNQVWLADEVGYQDNGGKIQVWTEGKNLKLATRHATGAQTIMVGKGTVAITEPFVEYSYSPPEVGLVKVSAERREDLLIKTNGHFAFSEAQYFNPDPVRLTADTDLDRLGVNYIITNYKSPQKVGDRWVAKVNLSMNNVYFEDKSWKFVFSLPTVEQPNREFILHSIKMTFLDQPGSLKEIVNKFWHYVLAP